MSRLPPKLGNDINKRRMQPVFLMLDTSGSMAADCGSSRRSRISVLNENVKKMLNFFAEYKGATEIQVGIITFGNTAKLQSKLSSSYLSQWRDLTADGGTPLGDAIQIAGRMLEDIDESVERPILVLVSDGEPQSDWEAKFNSFLGLKRASKSIRLALGISVKEGTNAYKVLKKFVSQCEEVFLGEINEIEKFFNFVMQSATGLIMSKNPKVIYRKLY